MNTKLDTKKIEAIAIDEIEKEEFRKAVDKCKARIIEQRQRSFINRIFPWKIIIVRR